VAPPWNNPRLSLAGKEPLVRGKKASRLFGELGVNNWLLGHG